MDFRFWQFFNAFPSFFCSNSLFRFILVKLQGTRISFFCLVWGEGRTRSAALQLQRCPASPVPLPRRQSKSGRPRTPSSIIRADDDGSLEGSFSAGSTATIATKYSFFQVFRDLQNYLAKFSKFCKILQKISDFRKNQHFFLQKSGNFAKFCKICDFLQILQLFQKIS